MDSSVLAMFANHIINEGDDSLPKHNREELKKQLVEKETTTATSDDEDETVAEQASNAPFTATTPLEPFMFEETVNHKGAARAAKMRELRSKSIVAIEEDSVRHDAEQAAGSPSPSPACNGSDEESDVDSSISTGEPGLRSMDADTSKQTTEGRARSRSKDYDAIEKRKDEQDLAVLTGDISAAQTEEDAALENEMYEAAVSRIHRRLGQRRESAQVVVLSASTLSRTITKLQLQQKKWTVYDAATCQDMSSKIYELKEKPFAQRIGVVIVDCFTHEPTDEIIDHIRAFHQGPYYIHAILLTAPRPVQGRGYRPDNNKPISPRQCYRMGFDLCITTPFDMTTIDALTDLFLSSTSRWRQNNSTSGVTSNYLRIRTLLSDVTDRFFDEDVESSLSIRRRSTKPLRVVGTYHQQDSNKSPSPTATPATATGGASSPVANTAHQSPSNAQPSKNSRGRMSFTAPKLPGDRLVMDPTDLIDTHPEYVVLLTKYEVSLKELEKKKEELAAAVATIKERDATINELQEENFKLKNEAQSLKASLDNAVDTDTARERLELLQKKVLDAKRIKQLDSTVKHLRGKLDQAEQDVADRSAIIQSTEQKVRTVQRELNDTKKLLEKEEKVTAMLQKKLNDSRRAKHDQLMDATSADNVRDMLELREKKQGLKDAQSEIKGLQLHIQRLEMGRMLIEDHDANATMDDGLDEYLLGDFFEASAAASTSRRPRLESSMSVSTPSMAARRSIAKSHSTARRGSDSGSTLLSASARPKPQRSLTAEQRQKSIVVNDSSLRVNKGDTTPKFNRSQSPTSSVHPKPQPPTPNDEPALPPESAHKRRKADDFDADIGDALQAFSDVRKVIAEVKEKDAAKEQAKAPPEPALGVLLGTAEDADGVFGKRPRAKKRGGDALNATATSSSANSVEEKPARTTRRGKQTDDASLSTSQQLRPRHPTQPARPHHAAPNIRKVGGMVRVGARFQHTNKGYAVIGAGDADGQSSPLSHAAFEVERRLQSLAELIATEANKVTDACRSQNDAEKSRVTKVSELSAAAKTMYMRPYDRVRLDGLKRIRNQVKSDMDSMLLKLVEERERSGRWDTSSSGSSDGSETSAEAMAPQYALLFHRYRRIEKEIAELNDAFSEEGEVQRISLQQQLDATNRRIEDTKYEWLRDGDLHSYAEAVYAALELLDQLKRWPNADLSVIDTSLREMDTAQSDTVLLTLCELEDESLRVQEVLEGAEKHEGGKKGQANTTPVSAAGVAEAMQNKLTAQTTNTTTAVVRYIEQQLKIAQQIQDEIRKRGTDVRLFNADVDLDFLKSFLAADGHIDVTPGVVSELYVAQHKQVLRLLKELKVRTPLTNVTVVDAIYKEREMLATEKGITKLQKANIPLQIAADTALLARFADYFTEETIAQRRMARAKFRRVVTGEFTEETGTQVNLLPAATGNPLRPIDSTEEDRLSGMIPSAAGDGRLPTLSKERVTASRANEAPGGGRPFSQLVFGCDSPQSAGMSRLSPRLGTPSTNPSGMRLTTAVGSKRVAPTTPQTSRSLRNKTIVDQLKK